MKTINFRLSLIQKAYNLYLHLYPILKNLPKRNRYTLGEKIECTLLDIVESVSLASIQIKTLREPIVHKASCKIEVLKLLVRLSYDLNLINDHQYISLEDQVNEIGRMVGGWIKSLRTQ